jgi:hypothetical protein
VNDLFQNRTWSIVMSFFSSLLLKVQTIRCRARK